MFVSRDVLFYEDVFPFLNTNTQPSTPFQISLPNISNITQPTPANLPPQPVPNNHNPQHAPNIHNPPTPDQPEPDPPTLDHHDFPIDQLVTSAQLETEQPP